MAECDSTRRLSYRHYLLFVLTLLLTFNYVDRLALGIVLEDIKRELLLSDTQLGLLGGLAFALFYSLLGVPIARWADRGNRVVIIAVTVLLWTLGVGLCGLAFTFVQLLVIRVAVAVGEAGCVPPALSLIADYFDRAERPWATAIYGLGGGLSCIFGFFVAGWLNELYGWRTTFMLLASPGVLLAALAWFTLREPRIGNNVAQRSASVAVPASLRQICETLWGIITFRHLLLALSVSFFFSYGILQWQPAFFIRSYGLTTGQIGTWFAITYGVTSIVGTYICGELAVRYAANNERLQLRAMGVALAVSSVLLALTYLAPNVYLAFLLMGFVNLLQSSLNGPLISTIQTVVPERMCAVAFALVYMVANLVGMGLGPLLVGVLSDAFQPWAAEESLRYALLILAPGYLWVTWHSWMASNTVEGDIAATHANQTRGGGRNPIEPEPAVRPATSALRASR